MKKAIIYFFSGTGNTRIAAKEIAEELNSLNIDTIVFDVRSPINDVPNPNLYDIILFGYPIHAFNVPQFFLDFIKKLPSVNHIPTYVFKTSGEPFRMNSASSFSLVKKLEKKGFNLSMDKHLLMPYHIMFRYNDALAKQMFKHTKGMAKLIAILILQNNHQKLKYNPFYVMLHYLFRIQWIGAKL
ncbi:MAG: flavodoxin family protein, partial [Acholeplasmataceae bacterium]|nr:flavodoxin family protein [Acholeplasmataceae bacterium]